MSKFISTYEEHIYVLVCVGVCVCVCVHIPTRACYLSNSTLNYFKVRVLIETAYVFGGVFFPQGQTMMAREACFFFGLVFAWYILLFLIGSLGGY